MQYIAVQGIQKGRGSDRQAASFLCFDEEQYVWLCGQPHQFDTPLLPISKAGTIAATYHTIGFGYTFTAWTSS